MGYWRQIGRRASGLFGAFLGLINRWIQPADQLGGGILMPSHHADWMHLKTTGINTGAKYLQTKAGNPSGAKALLAGRCWNSWRISSSINGSWCTENIWILLKVYLGHSVRIHLYQSWKRCWKTNGTFSAKNIWNLSFRFYLLCLRMTLCNLSNVITRFQLVNMAYVETDYNRINWCLANHIWAVNDLTWGYGARRILHLVQRIWQRSRIVCSIFIQNEMGSYFWSIWEVIQRYSVRVCWLVSKRSIDVENIASGDDGRSSWPRYIIEVVQINEIRKDPKGDDRDQYSQRFYRFESRSEPIFFHWTWWLYMKSIHMI